MEKSGSDSNKKRKIRCEEEDEEAKMETFFALVRNIRDNRDRWIGNKRGKIITAKEEEENRVWKPTFQLEDFADEKTTLGASQSKTCDKEEDAEKGIDLKLSL